MEPSPDAVVVPFGAPNDGRGLGLGLAALVHGLARVHGAPLGLAQIVGKRADEPEAVPRPLEALILPQQWRDLAGQGSAPPDVKVVLTGAFEPPDDVTGGLRLVAFDARDGTPRGTVDVNVDAERAGAMIVDGVEKVLAGIGGEVGDLAVLRDLPWTALESVLRAERCVLHDPTRGGPHDRLAAMMHLGRAIEESPEARYPAGRLAALALDAALNPRSDAKLAEAAERAVTRALADAPDQLDLIEATAALHLRLEHSIEAEAVVLAGLAREKRPRLYILLSQARRARGDVEGARVALDDAARLAPADVSVLVERGVVLAQAGDLGGAERAWRDAMAAEPLNPAAFSQLSGLAAQRGDATAAQSLVDVALAAQRAHPEVYRCALRLVHGAEPVGIARDTRIVAVARALLELTPEDAGAVLALAQALTRLDEKGAAIEAFARVEKLAPAAAIAAEAQRARFALTQPMAALEVDAVTRAARVADAAALGPLAVRARRLTAEHPVWPAWVALGVIERRRRAFASAREALVAALAASRGAGAAHRELARTYLALGDPTAALDHAAQAVGLEGETAETLGALAEALFGAGRRADGDAALARALSLAPDDAELQKLTSTSNVRTESSGRPSIFDALMRKLGRRRE